MAPTVLLFASIASGSAFVNARIGAEWPKAVADNGCWVDYATVYYWYEDGPAGYKHEPLHPPAERAKDMLCVPSKKKTAGKK